MYIRLLMALLLGSLLITANSTAEDALSGVRIVEGIVQQRPPNTRQTLGRRYVWNFKGKSYTVLMTIDIEKYNSYDGKERYDIPQLVEEGRTTIGNLTREFQNVFKQHREWSKQDRVDFVLSFVQSLPYTLDDVTTGYDEFRRYAIETLIEGGGDCEDTTILVAALLRGLGENTALITTPGHIALGVSGNFTGASVPHNGTKYYYCETTGTGLDCWRPACILRHNRDRHRPFSTFKNRTRTETRQNNNSRTYASHVVTRNNNTDTANAPNKNNA